MRNQFKTMLPAALDAIKAEFKEQLDENKPIPKEYQRYISGFGSSVRQMGLLPTLAVYADEDSGSTQSKDKLTNILLAVVKTHLAAKEADGTIAEAIGVGSDANESLFNLVAEKLTNYDDRKRFEHLLLDAAIAIKLAIRTFKLSKHEQ